MNKPSVLIAIPNMGWIHREVVQKAMLLSQDDRCISQIILPKHAPYAHNRAKITEQFLSQNFDWLLTIDDDNPPQKNPLDLIPLNLDVIGFPTPVWHNNGEGFPFYWNAVDEVMGGWQEHNPKEGLQEVDAVGSGCMLIARRVLEDLKDEHPWMRTWDERGFAVEGLDYVFCRKAKKKGYRIWTHYGYPCAHYKEIEMIEMIEGMSRVKESKD